MQQQWNKYGPTAARQHGRPGRELRSNRVTIDMHSHVAVPKAFEFVKPHLDLSTIPLAHFATPETKALNQQQDAERSPRMIGYDERLADLDAMGIDLQLVMPPPPQCYYTVPLVHGGGYLAAYSGRIDHAWGARSDCHADLPHPPTTYLKRIYFDTVVFTPHQLAELVRVFGADHVVMGTDYPYDMGEYDPVGHVAGVAEFDEATRNAIVGGNAKKLLAL
jgi:hypothetical protein